MSSRSSSFDRSNSIDSRSWSIGSSEFIIDEPEDFLEKYTTTNKPTNKPINKPTNKPTNKPKRRLREGIEKDRRNSPDPLYWKLLMVDISKLQSHKHN